MLVFMGNVGEVSQGRLHACLCPLEGDGARRGLDPALIGS